VTALAPLHAAAWQVAVVAADQTPQQQEPEDVGKAGPIGLVLIIVLAIAVVLLVRSMSRHLKRIPASFDEPSPDDLPRVPDTPAELFEERLPGQDLLDTLRRAPRAIEGPRPERPGDEPPR
jgi:hypothetical protein